MKTPNLSLILETDQKLFLPKYSAEYSDSNRIFENLVPRRDLPKIEPIGGSSAQYSIVYYLLLYLKHMHDVLITFITSGHTYFSDIGHIRSILSHL